jgi:hypothetical protein
MYGIWKSREHFSVAGSNPAATSSDMHALAATARRDRGAGRAPSPVIAEHVAGVWQLVYFAEPAGMREITRDQGRKYEGVRAGTVRWSSTMRAVPPVSETTAPTRDLDTATPRTRPGGR